MFKEAALPIKYVWSGNLGTSLSKVVTLKYLYRQGIFV
jgi:hypothetical protein